MPSLHKDHPTVLLIQSLHSKGLSQKQIAHEAGVSLRGVNYWLNHERELSLNRRRGAITVEDATLARFNDLRKRLHFKSSDKLLIALMDSYEWVSK